MIIDKSLEFSTAQALTTSAASQNVIDVGQSHRKVGKGAPLWLVVQLKTDADDADGNETYTAALRTADNEGFASATEISRFTIERGTKAGTRYVLSVPYNSDRFLRVNYTLGGTTPALTVDAWLTGDEPSSWAALPDAVN